MEKFEIHILGCGSALPTGRHFPTSQVVNLRDKLYMIDCGEGAQLQLRRSRLKFGRLNHIFLSHLHGDHCFGLLGLLSTFSLLGRTSELHVYGPAGTEGAFRPGLDFFCRGLEFDVTFHEFSAREPEEIFSDRSVTVTTLPLQHRMPCCGFLFREKALLPHIRRDMVDFLGIPYYAINSIKEGGGWTTDEGVFYPHERLTLPAEAPRSYAYVSDTAYLPQIADLVRGADLLFHEATFAEKDAGRAKETFHSTARQAATIAREAEVARLLIGHFSSRYDDERQLLREAQEVFPDTLLAKENLCVKIG